ncbi:hypothetical protein [Halorubrum vacuolatum]|nr:hypothetical protein [Halorubrum vacuolatum]
MVQDRLRDGVRIAQLLASEVTGDTAWLTDLTVTDADPDVEPTVDGALAYTLTRGKGRKGEGGDRLAEVFVQPDRVRVEFIDRPDVAAEAAREASLRVRPKAVRPPRTLVFVEDGAQVKWLLPVLEAVLEEHTGE